MHAHHLATRRHRYDLARSPGRVPTTAGAISLVAAVVAAASLGRGAGLLSGFGVFDLLAPLGHGTARALAGALLLGFPALYAASLLAEASLSGRVFAWLGRRVRGSLCLLWSTLVAALLSLHMLEGHGSALLLGALAATFTLGGVAGRALDRQADPALAPLARTMPALLLSLAAVGMALVANLQGPAPAVTDLDGLLGSAALVGALLLLVGSAREVAHQLRQGPQRLFCRDALQRELSIH